MHYIDAIKGSCIVAIIFTLAVIIIPGQGPSDSVTSILTISTFLFAILSGFFISRLNNRYDKINEKFAAEDSQWASAYKTAKFLGEDFVKKITELIDKYYIVAFDFLAGDYSKFNEKYFFSVWDELQKTHSLNSQFAPEIFQKMIDFLERIGELRRTNSAISSDKLSRGQWGVLYFLSAIIIFSIFFLKTPEVYSQIIAALLSTVVIMVLLILKDLQNLRLTEQSLVTESGQEIFELIGRPRYYSQNLIRQGFATVPSHIKEYRLGLHLPGEEIKIKLIKR